jgi:hypothetical protein
MLSAGKLTLGVLACAAASIAALAQSAVISARSGLIHYVEGQVYLGDQLVETKFGTFPEVKENQQLKTEEGRAEVLLTPGVFLRLGENSSFRMLTNRLIDTRLDFVSGSAIVEAEDIGKDNSVTLAYHDATVHPVKKGVYRLDSDGGELRVFDGLAEVTGGGQTVEVKEGHLIALDTMEVRKFDKTSTDALNRWSERRDGYVSMANVAAANTLRTSMFSGGSGVFNNGWYYNPYFGMYSYVPGLAGMFYSPYGNAFFSPFDVGMAFMPGFFFSPYGNGFGGYGYGYGGIYNSINYKTVPTATKSSGIFGGSSGSATSGRMPSTGSTGFTSVGVRNTGNAAPISHGGGAAGGNVGRH